MQPLKALGRFFEQGKRFTTRLLTQGCQRTKLVSTLEKLYGRYHDFVYPYNVAVSRTISDVFAIDKPYADFQNPGHTFLPILISSKSVVVLHN